MSDLVRRQVGRLRRLVEDLLEISRLDAANVQIDWQDCDLGQVVRASLEPYADRVEIDTGVAGIVRGEPRRIERIVTNLVRNALAHGAPPVRVVAAGHRLTVTDSGTGYPPELLTQGPRRFATFSPSQGSGLGLTIATKHAEALGGELTLGNDTAGGACARVTLRRASSDAPTPKT